MRLKVKKEHINKALFDLGKWLAFRVKEKGDQSFSSLNEIRGSIDEESDELKDALHKKDVPAIYHELKDLAVACLFAMASIRTWGVKHE